MYGENSRDGLYIEGTGTGSSQRKMAEEAIGVMLHANIQCDFALVKMRKHTEENFLRERVPTYSPVPTKSSPVRDRIKS